MGWAPGGGARPGGRREDGMGGAVAALAVLAVATGAAVRPGVRGPRGDGVGELQPSAAAAAAAGVSVERASTSRTQDGAPR